MADTGKCKYCKRAFRYQVKPNAPVPVHCGAIFCSAMHDWDDEQWLGHVRMIDARRAAGIVELNDLDREALKRAGVK